MWGLTSSSTVWARLGGPHYLTRKESCAGQSSQDLGPWDNPRVKFPPTNNPHAQPRAHLAAVVEALRGCPQDIVDPVDVSRAGHERPRARRRHVQVLLLHSLALLLQGRTLGLDELRRHAWMMHIRAWGWYDVPSSATAKHAGGRWRSSGNSTQQARRKLQEATGAAHTL